MINTDVFRAGLANLDIQELIALESMYRSHSKKLTGGFYWDYNDDNVTRMYLVKETIDSRLEPEINHVGENA